jgi:Fe-Mn family superoxide dismutase
MIENPQNNYFFFKKIISEIKKIGIEKLPYSYSALKKFVDPKTMNIHYNKHYIGYVKKLNDALSKKDYGDLELEGIIKKISRYNKTIRNNAGGAFNHALFWNMLSPTKQKIPNPILEKIKQEFENLELFKKKFEEIAKARFGSGWVWLVLTKRKRLKIMSTPNQDNPLMDIIKNGGFPLLGLDLWEHSYYLKYQNKRDEYIHNFWDVVNWNFVNKMYLLKTKTSLIESKEQKKLITEGKSQPCSRSQNIFYKDIFNTNQNIKWEYRRAIDKILKEVYKDKYIENPEGDLLPGVFNLEGDGRSVINKLNTNYSCFCILVNDINQVISMKSNVPNIDFSNKDKIGQKKELDRLIGYLDMFKFRIFREGSSTLENILNTLSLTHKMGEKREQNTAEILNNFLGKDYKVSTIGSLESRDDAIKGIDLIISKGEISKTGQVKPFKSLSISNGEITLYDTGSVKKYNTDWMIFQSGNRVLVFEKQPKIVDGKFVFPIDSLLYDIQ